MLCGVNKRPLISIVVPIYNAEISLKKCIDSLIDQTYKYLEFILINDGSSDESEKICREYLKADKRIVFYSQENKGAGSARNLGIKIAKGEYIAFVDADDYLHKLYVEYLYNLLLKYKTDVSICGRQTLRCDGGIVNVDENYGDERKITSIEVVKDILYGKKYGSGPVCKLYKKTLWEGLCFSNVSLGEDLAVIYRVIERSKYIAIGNSPYYFRVLSKGSLLRKPFEISKMELINVAEDIVKYSREYPDIYKAAISRLVDSCFHLILQIGNEFEYIEHKKRCSDIIKKNRSKIIFDKENRFKTKVACALSYLGIEKLEYVFVFYKRFIN